MWFVRIAVVGLALIAGPALAGPPAALIIDVTGSVSPEIEAFDEVEAGTELTLSGGAELTLSHYGTCDEVSVRGGSIEVGTLDLGLARTTVVSRSRADCSEPVSLSETDTASASVIMRNFEQLPKVPLSPAIVISGKKRAGFDAMAILRGDKQIATLTVAQGKVAWPTDGLYLSNGTKYVLVLTGRSGEHRATVVADRERSGRVVLRP